MSRTVVQINSPIRDLQIIENNQRQYPRSDLVLDGIRFGGHPHDIWNAGLVFLGVY
jgi:hypothetical protein